MDATTSSSLTYIDPADATIYAVTILEPLPGNMNELEAVVQAGYLTHQSVPGCTAWHTCKTIDMAPTSDGWNKDTGQGSLVLYHSSVQNPFLRWVSLDALQQHGRKESVMTREALKVLLATQPVMQVPRTLVRFKKEVKVDG